jgi:hypothetical protein
VSTSTEVSGSCFRIATVALDRPNGHGLGDEAGLQGLCEEFDPDVVCVQGLRCAHLVSEAQDLKRFVGSSWQIDAFVRGAAPGAAILSRRPLFRRWREALPGQDTPAEMAICEVGAGPARVTIASGCTDAPSQDLRRRRSAAILARSEVPLILAVDACADPETLDLAASTRGFALSGGTSQGWLLSRGLRTRELPTDLLRFAAGTGTFCCCDYSLCPLPQGDLCKSPTL